MEHSRSIPPNQTTSAKAPRPKKGTCAVGKCTWVQSKGYRFVQNKIIRLASFPTGPWDIVACPLHHSGMSSARGHPSRLTMKRSAIEPNREPKRRRYSLMRGECVLNSAIPQLKRRPKWNKDQGRYVFQTKSGDIIPYRSNPFMM